MGEFPSGTVTFLFTDLEGSTRLWEAQREAMAAAVARHDVLLEEAIGRHGGAVFSRMGDGMAAAFGSAPDAIAAAVDAQRALSSEPWDSTGPLRARMGLHTGEGRVIGDQYESHSLNRCARLMAVAHGGQVVISGSTAALVGGELPMGVDLIDLGEHRLRDLAQPMQVFQLCASGLPAEFAPLRSIDVLRTNLPLQLTSFVGRDEDVKVVGDLLREHRVVTLTGVGGVGKTRLAFQVAADALDEYPDGVWLVELAPVGEEARVVDALAAAFGVVPSSGTGQTKTVEQSLIDAVKSNAVLVVLDNCEHLLSEASRLAGVLVRAAPELAVLATSREPLGVPGEHVVALRSLDAATSVRLFTERALAADSSFVLDDVERVEHLCQRLDGIPLAIELAAARVRMFSPAELAERLDQRFRLLTGGRGAVERHQTLRAAIDWSYELLSARDRSVFDRLSIFAGGATLDAAQALCSGDDIADIDVVDALASLIDKSLVDAEHSSYGTRYRQLETIRQYAEERLMGSGAADAARERHAHYFGAFAREAGRGLGSSAEIEWATRVEADLDNIRAAVAWTVAAGETDLAMRIAGALVTQAVERPIWATASIAEEALRAPGADEHPWRAIVMGEASWSLLRRGDVAGGRDLAVGALDAQRAGARFTATVWSYAAYYFSDRWRDVALVFSAEALERAEAAGDVLGAVALRNMYASSLLIEGRESEARAEAERGLADARALAQPALIAMGLLTAGEAVALSGEPERGLAMVRESLELSSEIDSNWQTISALNSLAALEAIYGDAARVAGSMRTVLVTARDTGETHHVLGVLHTGLCVFNCYGRPDLAARAAGKLASMSGEMYGGYWFWLTRGVADARTALGDERYDALAVEGASIPWDLFLEETIEQLDTFLEQGRPPE